MRIGLALLLTACLHVPFAAAQSTNQSGIDGRVTDESGGVLPGVTITISSPALQLRQVTAVTDSDGHYRFSTLPAGVYAATYELQGFQVMRRQDLLVGVATVVTVDVKLGIGAVEESVTVSGASPVVDVRTTVVSTNVTREMLDTLPTSRSMPETVKLTPGIRMTGAPDVGGSTMGTHENYNNYGAGISDSGTWMTLDGVFTLGAFNYYDMGAMSEVQVRSLGNDASVPTSGVNFTGVLKAGGNQFHGGGLVEWQSWRFQGNNVDDGLKAQGVTKADSIDRYYDSSADLGGRLIRDRLWFYGAGKWQGKRNYLIGYSGAPGPDGHFFTADDVAALNRLSINNYVVKLTTQLTPGQKLEGFYDYNNKHTPDNGASAFRPLPSVEDYTLPAKTYKAEWTFVATNRSLFNVLAARTGWVVGYAAYSDEPSTYDFVTLRYGGAYNSGATFGDHVAPSVAPSDNKQVSAAYSYSKSNWFGNHDLKVGFDAQVTSYNKASNLRDVGTGGKGNDLANFFSNGVPFEVELYNSPVDTLNSMNYQTAYVKDNWQLGDRATINAGVRFERAHAFFPPQTKPAGPFSTALDFPQIEVYDWRAPAPRVGLSYALTDDRKTVLKATFGRYNFYSNAKSNQGSNPNGFSAQIYRWNDLNGNGKYDTGERGDYVNAVGGASQAINQGLTQPKEYEATLHVERELFRNFLTRAGYVYKRETDLFQNVNVLRPFSAYTTAIAAIDPGADGRAGTADDGGALTYYDYSPSFAGANFEQFENFNSPANTNRYHNFEIVGEKRLSNRWQMLAYFLATKRDAWIAGVPDTPNVLFPKDETWTNQFTASGSYLAPFGLQLAATYIRRQGDPYARTIRYTAGLKQLTQVSVRAEPLGAQRYPTADLVNIRVQKQIPLTAGRLALQIDLYNALNVNSTTASVVQSGATYGRVTAIVPPRIARFGASFQF